MGTKYDEIPRSCLKLDPLTIEDLRKASADVAPSASKQDIEKINHFYKHKTLPPQATENIRDNYLPSSPRAPPHGLEVWLIGIMMVIFALILLVMVLKSQGRI